MLANNLQGSLEREYFRQGSYLQRDCLGLRGSHVPELGWLTDKFPREAGARFWEILIPKPAHGALLKLISNDRGGLSLDSMILG